VSNIASLISLSKEL